MDLVDWTMAKVILLTGFSNYDKYYINPSEEIVEFLDGSYIYDYKIHGLILPVSITNAPKILINHLNTLKPDIVLGLGLSPKAKNIIIELVSTNIAHFPDYKDIDGETAWMKLIGNNRVEVLSTRLPIFKIMESCCREKGFKISVGLSIGTYLCNIVGYEILRYAYKRSLPGGFIHIPPSTDLALRLGLNNYMPLKEMLQAITCILATTIEEI